AAKAVFGPSFRVTRERGRVLQSSLSPRSAATVHPSSILRTPDRAARRSETRRFIADLRKIAQELDGGSRATGPGRRAPNP
ncbi:MAG TPA: uracil-DNA glycosylase, partial [Thermoanaerobaculia bacterium]|nr:uracil-DNA glycosylase [Thermoanaerobaculia bacterium]